MWVASLALEIFMFGQRWVIRVQRARSGVFLQRASLLFMWCIRNTDLLMRPQSQDHQELPAFGRKSVSPPSFFFPELTQSPLKWPHIKPPVETDLMNLLQYSLEDNKQGAKQKTIMRTKRHLWSRPALKEKKTKHFGSSPAKALHPSSH